ncbi:hypothetical protein B0J15DRAFT_462238 [Fusarium solani]|uniref:Ankyrin repeat protein n=1 Tax=Fusarium solani TaxID=169388 RepID=A0A9P9R719_FUSSL|nr:uncharacterized protein B0J15DRAFT_462238 [Fusarium solani]KAH7268207.1 hypothetical protein B0J15DRAFT_462238 [Fusarium solani]
MRERSKAFEVFGWVNFPQSFSTTHIKELKTKLQQAFTLPDVSPLDVDQFGRNTAHICITLFGDLLNYSTSREEAGRLLDGLQILLSFLFKAMHVNIFVGESHNGSMLEYLAASGLPSLLPPVYDVLKTLKPEFDPELDQRPIWYLRDDRAMEQQRHLRIFRYAIHDRPDIIEDLGYGEVFLDISKRDKSRLQELINSTRFAEYVDERDFFRHNILHLCINWKEGLKLLLKERITHSLANEPDSFGATPLHYALAHSGNVCYSADGCDCHDAAEMILDTDCRVVVDPWADISLADSSSKVAMLLIQHLKQRRERLRKIAITHLSTSDPRELRVTDH